MGTVTFDKLAYLEALRASGEPEDQARAHTSALDAALHGSVVTQAVLQSELQPLKIDVAKIQTELTIMRLLAFSTLAGVCGILVKLYLPH